MDPDRDRSPQTDSDVKGGADSDLESVSNADRYADPQATYDRIASHFSKTREYAWPEVESFLDGRTANRALDVGCGNGRHCQLLADSAEFVVGVDVSRELLVEAGRRAIERGFADATAFVHGDAARLPFTADTFDLGVYVATLHHLAPRAARVRSLDEFARVLASDGMALVSTWSTAHDRFDRDDGFDTTVDWTLPGGETVPRYYHIYDPAEFREDVTDSCLRLVDFELSSGNCYAVVTPDR